MRSYEAASVARGRGSRRSAVSHTLVSGQHAGRRRATEAASKKKKKCRRETREKKVTGIAPSVGLWIEAQPLPGHGGVARNPTHELPPTSVSKAGSLGSTTLNTYEGKSPSWPTPAPPTPLTLPPPPTPVSAPAAPTPERPALAPPPFPEDAAGEAAAADPALPSPLPVADGEPCLSLLAGGAAGRAPEAIGVRNLAGNTTSTKWRARTATGGSFRTCPGSAHLDICFRYTHGGGL